MLAAAGWVAFNCLALSQTSVAIATCIGTPIPTPSPSASFAVVVSAGD